MERLSDVANRLKRNESEKDTFVRFGISNRHIHGYENTFKNDGERIEECAAVLSVGCKRCEFGQV